jgi:hypothetical protein
VIRVEAHQRDREQRYAAVEQFPRQPENRGQRSQGKNHRQTTNKERARSKMQPSAQQAVIQRHVRFAPPQQLSEILQG